MVEVSYRPTTNMNGSDGIAVSSDSPLFPYLQRILYVTQQVSIPGEKCDFVNTLRSSFFSTVNATGENYLYVTGVDSDLKFDITKIILDDNVQIVLPHVCSIDSDVGDTKLHFGHVIHTFREAYFITYEDGTFTTFGFNRTLGSFHALIVLVKQWFDTHKK